MVQQAKLYCDEKIASHPRGTKRNRALEEGNETRQAQGQVRGFEPGANDELLPMYDMPPLEDMPDTPIGSMFMFVVLLPRKFELTSCGAGQNRSTDLIPLEKGPQVLGWEASVSDRQIKTVQTDQPLLRRADHFHKRRWSCP